MTDYASLRAYVEQNAPQIWCWPSVSSHSPLPSHSRWGCCIQLSQLTILHTWAAVDTPMSTCCCLVQEVRGCPLDLHQPTRIWWLRVISRQSLRIVWHEASWNYHTMWWKSECLVPEWGHQYAVRKSTCLLQHCWHDHANAYAECVSGIIYGRPADERDPTL